MYFKIIFAFQILNNLWLCNSVTFSNFRYIFDATIFWRNKENDFKFMFFCFIIFNYLMVGIYKEKELGQVKLGQIMLR